MYFTKKMLDIFRICAIMIIANLNECPKWGEVCKIVPAKPVKPGIPEGCSILKYSR